MADWLYPRSAFYFNGSKMAGKGLGKNLLSVLYKSHAKAGSKLRELAPRDRRGAGSRKLGHIAMREL